MRLWSIHPKYLDRMGLLAVWREGLLAQKVLLGKTRGYKNHPQLQRFQSTRNPPGAIAGYLREIAAEALLRGYHFDAEKIGTAEFSGTLPVSRGQVSYEFGHLLKKLEKRDRPRFFRQMKVKRISLHPLFHLVSGKVETWERV
jgi:hypothetical protein